MRAAKFPLLVTALLCAPLAGCERPAGSAAPETNPPATGAAGPRQKPPAEERRSVRSAPVLRDWVRDPAVVESERRAAPLRLVCTAPSTTEICCALGLRAQLVGRTRFCDYPPGIESVTPIGALDQIDAEVLLALEPDLLLVSGASRAITERLVRLGLRFESLPDRRLEDVFVAIARAGELTGRPQTARRLSAGLRADLARIAQCYSNVAPARVLLLLGTLSDPPAPPFVAGPGSFYDDLLRLAGHRNVADAGTRAFGQLSLEAIVRADPDVIIEIDADGKSRPGGDADAVRIWGQLGALRVVAQRRVHVLTGKHHVLLGPRIAHSFAALCQAIAGPQDD